MCVARCWLKVLEKEHVSRFRVNMAAEHGVWPLQEQILEKICEQIADVHCVTGCRADYRSAQDGGTDTRCPRAGDGRAVGETVEDHAQGKIQQRTVEHVAADTPVPQDVEELAEFLKAFSQDRVQLLENPAVPLAEKIVELPVIQTEEKTQQGVNACV